MADDIGGVWRTIGGRRVFIKTGHTLQQAMKESGKFGRLNQNKKSLKGVKKPKKEGQYMEDVLGEDVDRITTREQLGSDYFYHKLVTSAEDAERYNYHSDYWGNADTYQEEMVDFVSQIEPYIGKEFITDYDGEEVRQRITGVLIDDQYNSLSHAKILVENVDENTGKDYKNKYLVTKSKASRYQNMFNEYKKLHPNSKMNLYDFEKMMKNLD